ncbi:iron(III) transport system ATP-binding protein/multiple sugar transport system ATP-binding protein [Oribacterium sp. KHPX15]|uniref:ATP-binding cassette domain-containing protein n=1 Tax=unclassified Oribacterium TaxID=2629782 RepID=UPI0005D271A2|nr:MULTISPECIES: ATP-binding cassette domain-containing protein [unclassified Oribacterium]SEA79212.1 iron(III) transport system ATP-binding protein/multiple sugar transport system ATP-binding protein [Oribacterium sp. KHPX15]
MFEIKGIIKEYPSVRALDNVSLSIDDGELISIQGESGCGKSTLLQIIAGIIMADSGTITKNNEPLSCIPHKRGVSMVFQDSLLFNNMTVSENILFGCPHKDREHRDKTVRELADAYGIGDLLKRYPYQISGGQARRAALARALACERELLLLDEPFSNLDKDLKENIIKRTRELCEGKCSAILVTHSEAEALAFCDRHLYMEEGHIL